MRFFDRLRYGVKLYVEPEVDGQAMLPEDLKEDLRTRRAHALISCAGNAALLLPKWPDWRRYAVPHVDISSHTEVAHRIVWNSADMIDLGLRYCRMAGHLRVGMIGSSDPEIHAAFTDAARACGIETRQDWLAVPDHTGRIRESDGHACMLSLWRVREKPDALIVTDDVVTKGVCQAVLQLGVRVPDDLVIVTHANRDSGIFYPFPLPRLEYDMGECARAAGELLLDLIADPDLPPRQPVIRPVLRLPDGLAIAR
jgi:DNA-binding LacI/PurR family transcriptional regulator